MVYIPSCPEKKDGQGRLKKQIYEPRKHPLGPFLSPGGRCPRGKRSGLGLGPGSPPRSAFTGSGSTSPENAPRPSSFPFPAPREQSRASGYGSDCQPRPDLGSLHLSAESGFFLFRSIPPDLCPAPPVYCQELAGKEKRVRRSDGLSGRGTRETQAAIPPSGMAVAASG